MFRLLAIFSLLISSLKSCSLPAPPDDGTLYVGYLNLLENDPNSVLVNINEYEGSDTQVSHCKVMNTDDGTVGAAQDCDDYSDQLRDWSEADVDPTNTSILSVVYGSDGMVRPIGTTTVTLQRNGEEIIINGNFYEHDSDKTLYYKMFTLQYVTTTYIIFSYGSFSTLSIIGVAFEGDNDNAYTIYSVTPEGDWGNFDIESNPSKIEVYESINVIKLPLVCCLCDPDYIAVYDIVMDPSYVFNVTSVQWGASVDTEGAKSYVTGYYGNYVKVYSFTDASEQTFELDLTDDRSNGFMHASYVIFLLIGLVVQFIN